MNKMVARKEKECNNCEHWGYDNLHTDRVIIRVENPTNGRKVYSGCRMLYYTLWNADNFIYTPKDFCCSLWRKRESKLSKIK
jgi:hypothetical protein